MIFREDKTSQKWMFPEIKTEKNWQNHSLVIYIVNYSYALHGLSNSQKYFKLSFKSPPKQIIQKKGEGIYVI